MDLSKNKIKQIDVNISRYNNKIYKNKDRLIFILDNKLKNILRQYRLDYLPKYTVNGYKNIIRFVQKKLQENCFVILTDVENSYSSINRLKLYEIMKNNNIENGVIEFLKCYYDTFSFYDNKLLYTLEDGLITGCPLSAALFYIYLNDSIDCFKDNIITYHDDIVIWSNDYDTIKNIYYNLVIKLNENHLKLNLKKNKFIYNQYYNEFNNEPVNFLKFNLYPTNNYLPELLLCMINYSKNKKDINKYFKEKDLWDNNTLKIYNKIINNNEK